MLQNWVKILAAVLMPPLGVIAERGLPNTAQEWASMAQASITALTALMVASPFQNTAAPSAPIVPPGASGA